MLETSSSRGVPLVGLRPRRWLKWVMIPMVAWMFGVGMAVRDSRRPVLFDRWFDSRVASPSGWPHVWAGYIADAGDPRFLVPLVVVLVVLLLSLRDVVAAVTLAIAPVVAATLVEAVLKPFFGRRLPGLPSLSFPSGHAVTAFAVAGAVLLALGPERPLGRYVRRVGRRLLATVVLVGASTIGLAMVVLQAHFATDVLTGAALGLVTAVGTAWCVDIMVARCRLTGDVSRVARQE